MGWADNSVFPNFGLAVRLPGFPTTARCRVWRRIGWLHSVARSHVGARQVPEPAWGVKFVTRAVPAGPGSRREDSELCKERWPFGLPVLAGVEVNLCMNAYPVNAEVQIFMHGYACADGRHEKARARRAWGLGREVAMLGGVRFFL